jgi:hypothetical protein
MMSASPAMPSPAVLSTLCASELLPSSDRVRPGEFVEYPAARDGERATDATRAVIEKLQLRATRIGSRRPLRSAISANSVDQQTSIEFSTTHMFDLA